MKFQALSWFSEDIDEIYKVNVFGVNSDGESLCLSLTGFKPYFYVKIPSYWNKGHIYSLQNSIEKNLPDIGISNMRLVSRKDFWGFNNNATFSFLRIDFDNFESFKKVRSLFERKTNLDVSGKNMSNFPLYESNIDPFIRIFHLRGIKPSSWIEIDDSDIQYIDSSDSSCALHISCVWTKIHPTEVAGFAKFKIASFDIECTSSHGDFPVPRKTYKKSANELYELYESNSHKSQWDLIDILKTGMYSMFDIDQGSGKCSLVYTKTKVNKTNISKMIDTCIDDIYDIVSYKSRSRDQIIEELLSKFKSMKFPAVEGDHIISIGVAVHKYGYRECCDKYILTLGSCDPVEGVIVKTFEKESDLLLSFRSLIVDDIDPDVITGYNINGFDFWYMYERCAELNIWDEFCQLGRLRNKRCKYVEQQLSSSALGDNMLRYIDITGRVIIDVMKVVQRDHKLDSYKLDNVASHFMGQKKHDVTPQDIFRLQRGTSHDRKILAEYCVQDCALCNHLIIKLEIMASNIGMSNVCLVPLSYIFMRGQGIKIFSLIMNECKEAGYLIPVIKAKDNSFTNESYEGAIVLDPNPGIYINEPVTVLDYASLYPSSMISENLSHDSIVIDPKYDNLPGVDYINVSYDLYDNNKTKIGERVCRYYQPKDNEKSLIPKILMKLLHARKSTRKRITQVRLKSDPNVIGWYNSDNHVLTTESDGILLNIMPDDIDDVYNSFDKSVLDGLQNAYKITANSLYGQCGARTSPIYMKDIAACTTATGRRMIMEGKEFLETKYNANVVYGDTDSLFVIFKDNKKTKRDAILPAIEIAKKASSEFRKIIKKPHDLEYEKTFWPFILLSKKRYVGNKYEDDDVHFKQNSMGIVLKRRDNAPIVKIIYGGLIDIILNKHDVKIAVEFLRGKLDDMLNNKISLSDLVITKSLRSEYKDPSKIAHKVLADRMGERDPGNKPQTNDRIPYVYIVNNKKNVLQGDRIEHIDYVRTNNVKPDIKFYITNQILNPVCQLLSIVVEEIPGFAKLNHDYKKEYKKLIKSGKSVEYSIEKVNSMKESGVEKLLFERVISTLENRNKGNKEILDYFKPIR